jgi:hypothetical protein
MDTPSLYQKQWWQVMWLYLATRATIICSPSSVFKKSEVEFVVSLVFVQSRGNFKFSNNHYVASWICVCKMVRDLFSVASLAK